MRLSEIFPCKWANFTKGRFVVSKEICGGGRRKAKIVLVREFNIE